jgi:hypothetical protein
VQVDNQEFTPKLDATPSASIKLPNIKNIRDISSAFPKIKPGKIFRTGCISKANETDVI